MTGAIPSGATISPWWDRRSNRSSLPRSLAKLPGASWLESGPTAPAVLSLPGQDLHLGHRVHHHQGIVERAVHHDRVLHHAGDIGDTAHHLGVVDVAGAV